MPPCYRGVCLVFYVINLFLPLLSPLYMTHSPLFPLPSPPHPLFPTRLSRVVLPFSLEEVSQTFGQVTFSCQTGICFCSVVPNWPAVLSSRGEYNECITQYLAGTKPLRIHLPFNMHTRVFRVVSHPLTFYLYSATFSTFA